MGQTRPLFVYFRPFLNTMTIVVQNWTTISCLGFELGTSNWKADESTELWRAPNYHIIVYTKTLHLGNLNPTTLSNHIGKTF